MKKFGFRFNDKKQKKRVMDLIEKVRKDDRWKDDAAKIAIRNIQIETRLGKNVKDDSKQPPLAQSTIEQRKTLSQSNSKGTSYGDAKSNLTLTGQLLESLKRTDHKTKVIIEPTESRKPYKYPSGKSAKRKHTPDNKQLAQYLKEQGRTFLGYNEKMKKAIKKKLVEHVRRHLKDLNKKK